MLSDQVHALAVSGRDIGDWVLCIHCKRVYKIGEFREVGGYQMCPYNDCNGDTVLDPMPLKDILKMSNDKLKFLENWRGSRLKVIEVDNQIGLQVVNWVKRQGGRIA